MLCLGITGYQNKLPEKDFSGAAAVKEGIMRGRIIFSNMLWRLAERSCGQVISFLVTILLARLLLPEDYGVISLISVITSILSIFVDGGFSTALIQKQHVDQTEYSTVFYFNLAVGILLYAGIFLTAPWIAVFYGKEELVVYIRILSFTLVLSGFTGVQNALVAKRMEYKRFFIPLWEERWYLRL